MNLILEIAGAFEEFPILQVVDILDSAVLFPVMILMFVVHQVDHPIKESQKLYWFFVPVLLSVLVSIYSELNIKPSLFGNPLLATIVDIGLEIMLFVLFLIFIPFVLVKTNQYIQTAIDSQQKKWLTYLLRFEVVFLSSWLLTILLSPFFEETLLEPMSAIALFTTLLIHWVAYTGVYKMRLLSDQVKIRELLRTFKGHVPPQVTKDPLPQLKEITDADKVKSPGKEAFYFKELEKLCVDQKIYRDPTLDRNAVAEMLGISTSYISQIINSSTNENFTTYINTYRVEEAKVLIRSEEFDNYSLLAIGLECGFSSKTTYFNVFKKITGMTPNAYRKAHQ
ncbi:MAG: AraC family transcriptional regulator [Bacteroidota bacterium]